MRSSDFAKLIKPELEVIIENANFTEEEAKIFEMLKRGKSLDEICRKQAVSKATLSRRINDIKRKLERDENLIKTVPIWEKVALTVEEAAEYSNIGINRIGDMLNEPGCPFVLCVGKGKRLVKRKEFERYIEKASCI